jgi:hypothetical protein
MHTPTIMAWPEFEKRREMLISRGIRKKQYQRRFSAVAGPGRRRRKKPYAKYGRSFPGSTCSDRFETYITPL